VVALDGFTGFKTATSEELPEAVAVMDPFHVVRLAGDALDRCRRRVQQGLHGHRGRKDDPLNRARRTLHTGADLLTDRLSALFAGDEHVEVEATWGIYQQMIAAYRETDRTRGREMMSKLIESISHDVPSRFPDHHRQTRSPETWLRTGHGHTSTDKSSGHPALAASPSDVSSTHPTAS
jgi:transposase